jgi:hypothetical protein
VFIAGDGGARTNPDIAPGVGTIRMAWSNRRISHPETLMDLPAKICMLAR